MFEPCEARFGVDLDDVRRPGGGGPRLPAQEEARVLGDEEEADIVDVGDELEGAELLIEDGGSLEDARVADHEVDPAGPLRDEGEHGGD